MIFLEQAENLAYTSGRCDKDSNWTSPPPQDKIKIKKWNINTQQNKSEKE